MYIGSLAGRAADSLAGARGKICLRGPTPNFFSDNNNPPPGRVRCNCFPASLPQFSIPNFDTLPQKTNILPFARKYFTQKNYRGPTKNFLRPQNLGARGNMPPAPPPPLGGPAGRNRTCDPVIPVQRGMTGPVITNVRLNSTI